MAEAVKKTTPATPPRPVPKARQNTIYDVPKEDLPKETDADKAAKKAAEESAKVEAEAKDKAKKINDNLAKDGSTRRIVGAVRHGKPKYFWANEPVPTQEVTEEELKAIDGMK